jgi:hypothetical protein
MGRKLFIFGLIFVLLVLAGCSSSSESQDIAKNCSSKGLKILAEYYEKQADKSLYIIRELYPDNIPEAYRQSSALFDELFDYDYPDCASVAHTHMLNAVSKMAENFRLRMEGKIVEADDMLDEATQEMNKFSEEFDKLKK